ncbi:MAG: divalent-cation tolerance protein CutA [Bacteroidetes bacterium]|nr:divalent-cation tolerance protein CutA [Bacteroidota bacterium]
MAEPTGTYCIAWITAGSLQEASALARALVEEHLAACCNVLPGIRSVYRWQGAVHEDEEHLLLCKTRRSLFEQLAARVRELHSYELPEIICTDITDGSAPYLNWIDESLSAAQ